MKYTKSVEVKIEKGNRCAYCDCSMLQREIESELCQKLKWSY